MPQMGAKREYQGYEYTFNGQNWVRGAATAAPVDPIERRFNAQTQGAELDVKDKQHKVDTQDLQDKELQARIDKMLADLKEKQRKEALGGDATESERMAGYLTSRIATSMRALHSLGTSNPGAMKPGVGTALVEGLAGATAANYAKDTERQQVEAHQKDVLDAALTLGTGAAYTAEQIEGYRGAYFPQLGDKPETVAAKQVKLRELLEAAKLKAGVYAPRIEQLLVKTAGDPYAPGAVTPTDVPPSEAQPDDLSWGDAPMEALSNLPKSAMGLAEGLVQPVLHPIDTLTSLGSIVGGVLNKLDPTGAIKFDEGSADAVGGWFASRYGSMDGFKHAVAEDPAGVLADAATVLTAGGAGAARVGGKIGQIGTKAAEIGNAIDPFVLATKAPAAARFAGRTGEAAASHVLGLPSGVGAPALEASRDAGRAGGEQLKALRANRRGNVPIDDVLTEAKDAVSRMREEASTRYKQGMGEVSKDVNVLPFTDIEAAVQKARAPGFFKGEVKDKSAAAAWGKVDELIQHWKSLDPAEYHTPEGMDALKQAIGDIANEIPMENRSASRAVTQAYNAVKREIVKQAPTYAKVMKDYERASTQVREVEKTLSLGNNASPDTALRKLQSILRNNANTNYGRRRDLGNMLEDYGADTLMPSLAGQQTSSWTPRGLAGITSSLGSTAALAGLISPKAAAALGVASPRVMGALAEKYGQATGPITKLFAERDLAGKMSSNSLGRKLVETPQAALFGSDIGRLSQIYGDQQQEEQPKPREAPAGVSVRLPVLEAVFGPGADFAEDGSVKLPDGTVVPPDAARQAIRAATAGAQ